MTSDGNEDSEEMNPEVKQFIKEILEEDTKYLYGPATEDESEDNNE